MKINSIALVGPISYDPRTAFCEFQTAEKSCKAAKIPMVFNPMEFWTPESKITWKSAMQDSLETISGVSHIMLLEDWQESPGATFEVLYGLIHDIDFVDRALTKIDPEMGLDKEACLNPFLTTLLDRLSD
tara:strand:- start:486 stop:875 length:390 start_codon:yes stop_codon:yes gene_type:complete